MLNEIIHLKYLKLVYIHWAGLLAPLSITKGCAKWVRRIRRRKWTARSGAPVRKSWSSCSLIHCFWVLVWSPEMRGGGRAPLGVTWRGCVADAMLHFPDPPLGQRHVFPLLLVLLVADSSVWLAHSWREPWYQGHALFAGQLVSLDSSTWVGINTQLPHEISGQCWWTISASELLAGWLSSALRLHQSPALYSTHSSFLPFLVTDVDPKSTSYWSSAC